MRKKLPYRVQFVMDYKKMPFRSTNFITLHGLMYMVPAFIGNVSAKIFQHFDRLPLDIPFFLLAMYTFIIVGIVIPSSMINRSKKCKEFVLKKILTPFLICRNW